MDNLRDALQNEFTLDAPTYDSWTFKDGAVSGEKKSLSIDWTLGITYDLAWIYSATTNVYTREQGGTSNLLEGRRGGGREQCRRHGNRHRYRSRRRQGRRTLRTTGTGDAMIFKTAA